MNKTQELTINEVKAMYFDDDALLLSPIKLYRYQFRGDRYYFYKEPLILNGDGEMDYSEVKLAVGVTTVTRRVMPTDEQLIKWIAEMGYDEAIRYRDERAAYGSLWHTCSAELLINKRFDLDLLAEIVAGYCAKNKLRVNEDYWTEDLKQDVLALAQFIIDYDVKPLAIELSLVSPRLGVAGTLDLFCEMTIDEKGFFGEVYKSGERKDEPKETIRKRRIKAIVDFKSGRKSNGGMHNAAQLEIQRQLLFENFPALFSGEQVQIYNLHPKDWRVKPSYTLVDQNENAFNGAGLFQLISLYDCYDKKASEKTLMKLQGVIDLTAGLDKNIEVKNIIEVVEESIKEDRAPLLRYEMVDDYLTENNYADRE